MEPANHPRMPSNDKLMQTSVTLYKVDSGDGSSYSGSQTSNGTKTTLTLAELSQDKGSLTDSARVSIQNAVVAFCNAADIGGVACLMDAAASASGTNTINVVAAQVSSVRTVTSGVRADPVGQSVNDTKQASVVAGSPITGGGLLEKEVLDNYLYSLSRFPGRTVSAAVTSEPSSSQVVLDYFVQEKNIFDLVPAPTPILPGIGLLGDSDTLDEAKDKEKAKAAEEGSTKKTASESNPEPAGIPVASR